MTLDEWMAWRPEELPRVQAVVDLRRQWMTDGYARLRGEWLAAGHRPADAAEARAAAETLPSKPWFLRLDAEIQDRLWDEVGQMVDARMPQMGEALEPRAGDLGTLEIDPRFIYPEYYKYDFHRQAGGIWRDDRGAFIYAMGARMVHVGKNDNFELHDRFAAAISIAPRMFVNRVLDLGCGFGKTTFSLARRFPDARVVGLDLSGPCLRLGRRMATERGLAIDWRHGDCARLDEADGSVDLVTTTMTLHELPKDEIERTIAESLRVLRPGGLLVTLENPYVGEPLRDVLIADHSEAIGEPHHRVFRSLDLAAMAREAGFAEAKAVRWHPFGGNEETERDPYRWSTPWSLMTARKGK
jgi:ubiquinone/menaquinone biosynthesis C-methylase UbiE